MTRRCRALCSSLVASERGAEYRLFPNYSMTFTITFLIYTRMKFGIW